MKALLWKLIHQWRDATTTEAAWIARDQIDIELDKIEAAATQEPVAYVRFSNGEVDYDADAVISNTPGDCMDESIEWLPVYAAAGAAGAAPVQQEPEPIQVCRLMKKEEGIWVAASEFYAGHPEQQWVELVSRNPDHWSIQRRVTGKQIADGLAKALAGTQAPAAKVPEEQTP